MPDNDASELVLRHDLGGHVTELVLNRPEKLNAFDEALRARFLERLAECEQDSDVRVIILRGAGRSFSVGADVAGKERSHDATASQDLQRLAAKVDEFLRVWDSPKPVIGQIHGHCLGIATILAAVCDLVYIAEDARLGWPKLPLGGGLLSPVWALRIGVHRSKELSFQVGSELSGAETVEWGMFNRAVPAEELESETRRLAARIARVPSDLLRIKKAANNNVLNQQGFRDVLRLSPVWDASAYTTDAAREARELIASRGLKAAVAEYRDA